MKKKEKRINKKIIIFIFITIIAILTVLAIVNYIVLPPKVSENAIKYKYHGYNIMHLKSITDDEDSMIFEFSSLNKYFNKNYNKKYLEKCLEKPLSSVGHDPYIKCYCGGDAESYLRYYPDYYIISTLTSNYVVINKDSVIEPEAIAFSIFESIYKGEYCDVTMNFNISEGYDNPSVFIGINKWDNNSGRTEINIRQNYNSQKNKWNPAEKYKYKWGYTSTDV